MGISSRPCRAICAASQHDLAAALCWQAASCTQQVASWTATWRASIRCACESGPAAGALAASFYSDLLGLPELISLDMGGTTAKTCVIEGGFTGDQPDRSGTGASVQDGQRPAHRHPRSTCWRLVLAAAALPGGQSRTAESWPTQRWAIPGPACYGLGGPNRR